MQSEVKIMFVLAHPDDESFITAGTICKYASEGVNIIYLCATCGESGRFAGERQCIPKGELKVIRCKELDEACKILGVAEHFTLDFPDGQLCELDPAEPVRKIVEYIRCEKPEIVITFDPTGITNHTDHIAVHAWVKEAFRLSSDPAYQSEGSEAYTPLKLYYLTVPSHHLVSITDSAKMQKYADRNITTVINVREYIEDKRRAIESHKSQYANIKHIFKFAGGMDELDEHEYYILAQCNIPDYAYEVIEDDLLGGIRVSKRAEQPLLV